MERKNIVVVGGGFAGIEAAIELSKKKYNVTLVSLYRSRNDKFSQGKDTYPAASS